MITDMLKRLIACVVVAWLADNVRTVPLLKTAPTYFWNNPLVALHWIRAKDRNQDRFISNRVTEISRRTNLDEWTNCSSLDNPADLLAGCISTRMFLESDNWWHGPSWRLIAGQVPSFKHDESLEKIIDAEPFREPATAVCPLTTPSWNGIVHEEEYSAINRFFRATDIVQRFVNNASKKNHFHSGPLTTWELQHAERYWLRVVQQHLVRAQIQFPLEHKRLQSTSSVLHLGPFLDQEGLLRVKGQLNLLNASTDIRHAILLPAEHKFISLILLAVPARTLHGGVELTLTDFENDSAC